MSRFYLFNDLQRIFATDATWISVIVTIFVTIPASARGDLSVGKVTQVIADSRSAQFFIEQTPGYIGDIVYSPANIRTDYARASIDYPSLRVLRMPRKTSIRIRKSCVELIGRASLLAASYFKGQGIDTCTSTLNIDSIHTIYLVGSIPDKRTEVKVLYGRVIVSPKPGTSEDGYPDNKATTTVDAGHEMHFSPLGKVLLSRRLTKEDYSSILRSELFSGFKKPLPNQDKINAQMLSAPSTDSNRAVIRAGPGDRYGLE